MTQDARSIPVRSRAPDPLEGGAAARFLAHASTILASSLDVEETLANVARAAVPEFADWCAVDLLEPDGTLRRVAVAHQDPDMVAAAHELHRRWPPHPDAPAGAHAVLRSGRSQLVPEIAPETLRGLARDPEHLAALERLALRSLITVALPAEDGPLGAITFGVSDPTPHRYDEEDLALAEELARRASAAADRARLHAETRASRERMRALVDGIDGILWEADLATLHPTYVSRKAEALLGHPAKRWTSEPGFRDSLLHPADREWVPRLVRERADAGRDFELEYRMVAASGAVLWVLERVFVERDGDGRPARLRGLLLDITERKLAERRFAAQHEVVGILSEAATLEESAPALLAAVGDHLGWEVGALWTTGEDGALACRAFWSQRGVEAGAFEDASRALRFEPGKGLPGRALRSGRAEWIEDLAGDAAFPRAAQAAAAGLRSGLAFPLPGRGGAHGVLEFFTRDARRPDERLLSFLDHLGWQTGELLERRAAERAVRESNARRGAILSASLDAIVTIDAHGLVTEWNLAAEETFGYARAEALGRPLSDLIVPPRLREAHRQGLARAVRTREHRLVDQRMELPALRRDGSEFPAEIAICPIEGTDPPQFTGFLRDISERKRLEDTLRASEARYRSLVEATAQIVWTTPPDGRVEEMPGWRAYTGQSEAEARGRGWLDAVHPEDRPALEAAWSEAAASGAPMHAEARVRRADGAWRTMAVRAVAIRDAEGAIREWVGTNTDVEDQKAAERALRESRHRYEQILDSVEDMVFCKTPGNVVTYANAAAARHHGVPAERLCGARAAPALDDAAARASLAADAEVFRTGRAVETSEEPNVRHDGDKRVFHTIKTPIFDTGGKVVELVGVSRDVTERKRVDGLLRFQKAMLEAQMEAVPDAILVVDVARRVVAANRRFEDVWGLDPGAAAAAPAPELLARLAAATSDPEAFQREAARLDEDAEGTVRDEIVLRDGRVLERFAAPVRAPEGAILGRVWTFRDVTGRKKAERQLARLLLQVEEHRHRLDALVGTVPGVVWEAWGRPDESRQRIDFVSNHVEAMLGYTVKEWLATPNFWLQIVHPDDRERAARESTAIFESGGSGSIEFRWVRKDGAILHVVTNSVAIKDDAGRPVGMRGVTLDVTDHRRALEAIRRTEERFHLLARATNDSLWDWDLSSDAVWWNERFYRTFGYDPDEVEPGVESWSSRVHPEDAERVMASIRAALAGPADRWSEEYRFRRKDGAYVHVLDRGFIARDGSGRARRLVGSMMDVTDRLRAREAVEKERNLLTNILQALPAGAVVAEAPSGRLILANEEVNRILEHEFIPAEGIAQYAKYAGLTPEGRPLAPHEYPLARSLMRSEIIVGEEIHYRTSSGKVKPLLVNSAPVRDGAGNVVAAVVTLVDITERRRAEQAIREGRERLDVALTAAELGAWDLDLATDASVRSLRHDEIFGYAEPQAEWGARRFMEHVLPEHRDAVEAAFKEATRTGRLRFECRIRRADGALAWIHAQGVVAYERGRPVRMLGVVADVTARKLAEEELQRRADDLAQLSEELRYQRDLNKTITDNAGSALFMMDARGHPVFVNPAALEMTGYASLAEMKDRPLHDSVHFRRPDGSPYPMDECPIDQANARVAPLKNQREIFCRKDGSLFPVQYNVAPVSKDGEQLGAVLEVRDVTEQERAERELRARAEALAALADALERSNRELDQFAYITSHDLKAPLRGIANLASWIEEDLGEAVTEDARRHMDLLRGRVHRMESLIDAILQYSRVGRVKVKPEEVRVADLLRETADLLALPTGFRVEAEGPLPTLVAERSRLQQVFMNLVGNAAKHHHDPTRGCVRVSAEDAGDFWRFTVADDGPGIAPRFHEKVFVIFQTLEARDKVEGTGVGLALVKKIVQTQGGEIALESDEGRGAAFRFTWPKAPAGAEERTDERA